MPAGGVVKRKPMKERSVMPTVMKIKLSLAIRESVTPNAPPTARKILVLSASASVLQENTAALEFFALTHKNLATVLGQVWPLR